MDEETRNRIEDRMSKLRKMDSLVRKYLEKDKILHVREGDLSVAYSRYCSESGPYDWPTFTLHAQLDVNVGKNKVLSADLGEDETVHSYVPGKWEKTFRTLFSSKKSVEEGKIAFRKGEERESKRKALETEMAAEEARLEKLGKGLGLLK